MKMADIGHVQLNLPGNRGGPINCGIVRKEENENETYDWKDTIQSFGMKQVINSMYMVESGNLSRFDIHLPAIRHFFARPGQSPS